MVPTEKTCARRRVLSGPGAAHAQLPLFAVMLVVFALEPTTQVSAITTKASGIWSGYLWPVPARPISLKSTTFTVYGKWKQPAVTCPVDNARVSIWVGIDAAQTVEQVGTIAVCNGPGKPVTYRAWWEMYATTGSRGQQPFAVSVGDTIEASVRYVPGGPSGSYVLAVKDLTNGRQFTRTKTCGARAPCKHATAEWIIERPGGGAYPLANYGKMSAIVTVSTASGVQFAPTPRFRYTMEHRNTALSTCGLLAIRVLPTPPIPSSPLRPYCVWHAAQ
jgi:hypothetical protein